MRYGLKHLEVDVGERVATIVMGDPVGADFFEARHPMHRELRDVFPALLRDDGVDGVIITGKGDVFFAGPSIEALAKILDEQPSIARDWMLESRDICSNIAAFTKPLVAAVNGHAISMGLQIAFLADFAVAVEDAVFQDSHVRLGLPAGDGGTMMWPLMAGMPLARRLLLRGERISSADAAQHGLLFAVTSRDELMPQARNLLGSLVRFPPDAYASTKLALNQWFRYGAVVSGDLAAALQIPAFADPNFRHRLTEIAQRRETNG
jgi:enoyl-CoA hydratase